MASAKEGGGVVLTRGAYEQDVEESVRCKRRRIEEAPAEWGALPAEKLIFCVGNSAANTARALINSAARCPALTAYDLRWRRHAGQRPDSTSPDVDIRRPLLSSEADPPLPQWPGLKVELTERQRRSLRWMLAKEAGTDDELVVERGCEDCRFSTHRGVDFQVRMSFTLRGGILADDMGYGKTLLAISMVASSCRLPLSGRNRKPPCGTTLIFVPENLVYQWLREFKKALGDAVSVNLVTSQHSSGRALGFGGEGTEDGEAKVYAITSIEDWPQLMQVAWADAMAIIIPYSLLHNVEPWFCLHHYHWRRIIIDELHEALACRTVADALGLISAQHLWGLSGTLPTSMTGDVAAVAALFGVSIPIDAINAGRFLDCYVRRNTATCTEAIAVHDNHSVVQPTPLERAIYLACQHDFDESKAGPMDTPDGYVPAFLSTWRGLQEHGREAALVKLCCHHQLTDTDMELLSTPAQSVERLHMWKRHHCKEARRLVRTHALLAVWMYRNCKHVTASSATTDVGDTNSTPADSSTKGDDSSVKLDIPPRILVLPNSSKRIVTDFDQKAWDSAVEEVDAANHLGDKVLLGECSNELEAMPFALCDRPVEAAERWLEWCKAAGLAPGTRGAISRLRKIMYDELWGRFVDGLEGWTALSSMPGRDWQADYAEAQLSRLMEGVTDYACSLRSLAFLEKVVQQAAFSELECGICLQVLQNPMITPCAHLFCAECINRSLQEKPECPQCRAPVRGGSQLNVFRNFKPDVVCSSSGSQLRISNEAKTEDASSSKDSATLLNSATAPSESSSGEGFGSNLFASHCEVLNAMDTTVAKLAGGTFGSKISALVAQLQLIRQCGEKAVVFAQWQDLIFKIHAALVKFGINTAVLAGNAFERASVLQCFEGPDMDVLLLSLEDSASGTNMAHANHVVLVHPMVAASAEEQQAYEAQAVGRVRRWGQKKEVQVWRFVMEGTIEADLAARHAAPGADTTPASTAGSIPES